MLLIQIVYVGNNFKSLIRYILGLFLTVLHTRIEKHVFQSSSTLRFENISVIRSVKITPQVDTSVLQHFPGDFL